MVMAEKLVLVLFASAMFFSLSSFAQHQSFCGHDHALRMIAQRSPEFRDAMMVSIGKARHRSPQKKSAVVHEIPVVFHIVHNNEDQNIPDSVIFDQIEILNQDYRRLNPNASETREIFMPVAGDAEIEFVLADTDPEGNITNGINRVETDRTGFEFDLLSADITVDEVKFAETGGADSWGNEYLNIWVCNIEASLLGQILGFAYPPVEAENWDGFFDEISEEIEGVVIHFATVGSNNPSADLDNQEGNEGGRTLTHEVGHFFGLRHIWGDGFFDGCSADDGIEDTPNASTAANYTCDYTLDNCTDDELPNMIENYMDYNLDDCLNMFTQEQVDRMRFNLTNYRPELIGIESGIAQMSFSDFKVYPNPSNGLIHIHIPTMSHEPIGQLRTMDGRLIQEVVFSESLSTLNIQLPDGFYFLQIQGVGAHRLVINN